MHVMGLSAVYPRLGQSLPIKPSSRCPHPRYIDLEVKLGKKNGLADPSRLKPLVRDDKQLLRVVIETPKGSRNKFPSMLNSTPSS
jgi:hypothetical protein